MRLLVTGAAGFIGANFVRHWVSAHPGDRVIALDALTYAGNLSSLDGVRDRTNSRATARKEPPIDDRDRRRPGETERGRTRQVEFVHADIGDLPLVEALLTEREVDVVVNFAAESHNSLAVLDPERFFRTNVLGTQQLLEACRRAGSVRFHHVSTCEVYGDLALDDPGAFGEDSPYRPRTPYNASKAGADHAVRAYGQTFGLPVTITNCANNYGPYQFPEKVIPLFVTRALSGRPLPVYATSANRREWLHVDDHCTAIESVLRGGRLGETYNVGSGVEVSVADLAVRILDRLGLPRSRIETVPDRPGHDRRYLLDSSRLRTELGWAPATSFDEGLAATVDWYADNPSWWQPLTERAEVDESVWARAG